MRHDLVWLSVAGWGAARDRAAPEHRDAILRWQREDWPAIVRRSDADAGPNQVCLGIALPPHQTGIKPRIALRAPASSVVKTAPALALQALLATGPKKWQKKLGALLADSGELTIRVYGSLALQAVTGQTYISPASDIDLLFFPSTLHQLRSGLDLLAWHARSLPLDGEIVFPGGPAVAWREWLRAEASNDRVLVKEQNAVRLAACASLRATLA